MRTSVLSILTLFLFSLPGSYSTAQETAGKKLHWVTVLVLPGVDLSPSDRLPVQDQLISSSMKFSGEELAWQLVAFSPLRSPRKEGEILVEVERLVGEGKKSYRYLKLPESQTVFQAAEKLLLSSPPAQCNPEQMANMYFYWARATLDSGDESGAQQLLAKIGRFDPEAGPDPATMPPNLVANYDIALEDLRNKPMSKVLLEITPGRGDLFVDCKPQPAGVVEIKGRAKSSFWLAAQIEGGTYRGSFNFHKGPRRHLKIFSPRPGDDARLADFMLALGRTNPTLGMLKVANDEDLDAISEILHVDLFILAEIRSTTGQRAARLGMYVPRKGVVGSLHDVPLMDTGRLEVAAMSTALDAISKSMKSPSLLAAVAQTRKPPPEPDVGDLGKEEKEEEIDEESPWYMTWWFWTAAGVVVAGAVTTGVVLGTMDTGESPSGKVILTVSAP